ncbi:MAG: hydantoinase B/oxoprolinase family protein, partial [Dehalococcoidia bacterium]|nr:hydantoinase B/oxoprolinase family protein [Dehalococcoidia bacterium]
TTGGWKAQILALKALSKALHLSPQAWRANASWGSGFVMPRMSGFNQYNKPYVLGFVESSMQGGGARANKDGFDVANIAGSTNTSIPNVEDTEQRYPFLFLHRGFVVDSCGPGKYRGGLSGKMVVKLHDVKQAECVLGYVGKDFPPDGFDGGKSGTTSVFKVKRSTNINELLKQTVPDFEDVSGDEITLPQKNSPFAVNPGDVLFLRCPGGGGAGNPTERDRKSIELDLREGYISREYAEKEYGKA